MCAFAMCAFCEIAQPCMSNHLYVISCWYIVIKLPKNCCINEVCSCNIIVLDASGEH